jgi:prefoldin subunit 5
MEPLSRRIDSLQEQLEEAMKTRLSMITRQVREIKAREDEMRIVKRKMENFERYASTGNLAPHGKGAIYLRL